VNACGWAISDLECFALERSLTDTNISVVRTAVKLLVIATNVKRERLRLFALAHSGWV